MIAIMVTIPIFLISLSHLAPRLGYWWPGALSVLSRSAVRPLSPFVNIVITTARLAVEGIRAANRASKGGRRAQCCDSDRPFHLVSCAAKAGIRNPKTRISIEALRVTGSPRKRGKTRGGGRYVIAGLVWAMS